MALFLFFLCAGLLAQPCAATPFQWEYTGSLNYPHSGHTATLLPSGKAVLVAGGSGCNRFQCAEVYDPASETWTITRNLLMGRLSHTATLLPNGEVLVAGGYPVTGGSVASAEVYHPARGTWTYTGSLRSPRVYHTATLLPNGIVLVAAGTDNCSGGCYGDLASAELYNRATGTWTVTGSLVTAREIHTATLLRNGKVLVAGGYNGGAGPLASAELYDPASGTWTSTGSLATARYEHTATLLPDGRVLVAGGYDGNALASAEVYNPESGSWTPTGSLNTARQWHNATLLANGKVLVAGGFGDLASAELYDPATSSWTFTGSLNTGRSTPATLLADGKVLVEGGGLLQSAELYDPGIVVATHVDGGGSIDHRGNEVTFRFSADQADIGSKLGQFTFCDPVGLVCPAKGRVQSLSIRSNTANFSGQTRLEDGTDARFSVSVTDNGEPGTSDTISISLSTGYSARGHLTSGDIRIH